MPPPPPVLTLTHTGTYLSLFLRPIGNHLCCLLFKLFVLILCRWASDTLEKRCAGAGAAGLQPICLIDCR